MIRLFYALISLFFSVALSQIANAEAVATKRSVHIIGRDVAHVSTQHIYLEDVANVSSKKISDEEAVLALQKIVVADAPSPGQKLTLSAEEILEKLRANGVDLQNVGFYLKRVMVVERVARTLSVNEVRNAVEEYIKENKGEAVLKDLYYRNNVKVAPGAVNFEVSAYKGKSPGQFVFNITALVDQESPVSFQVRGVIDEWRELPVAARPLKKGSIIAPEDIVMARLNTKNLPDDAAIDLDNLVGLELEQGVVVGEVFRRNKLSLPPVIEKGSVVTILYSKGSLTATASGIALSDAGEGEEVRVKNSSSRKVISCHVIEAGLVGVNQ